jgi:PIN domain nuclease of toxin-antitoxin system
MDRILIATARELAATLVTRDRAISLRSLIRTTLC